MHLSYYGYYIQYILESSKVRARTRMMIHNLVEREERDCVSVSVGIVMGTLGFSWLVY